MVNDYEIALTLLRQGSSDVMRKTFAKDIPEVIDLLEEKMNLIDILNGEIDALNDQLSMLEDDHSDLQNENIELSEVISGLQDGAY